MTKGSVGPSPSGGNNINYIYVLFLSWHFHVDRLSRLFSDVQLKEKQYLCIL